MKATEGNQSISDINLWMPVKNNGRQLPDKSLGTDNNSIQNQRPNNKFSVLKDLHNENSANGGANQECMTNQEHYSIIADAHSTDSSNGNAPRPKRNSGAVPLPLQTLNYVSCNPSNTKPNDGKTAFSTGRIIHGSNKKVPSITTEKHIEHNDTTSRSADDSKQSPERYKNKVVLNINKSKEKIGKSSKVKIGDLILNGWSSAEPFKGSGLLRCLKFSIPL